MICLPSSFQDGGARSSTMRNAPSRAILRFRGAVSGHAAPRPWRRSWIGPAFGPSPPLPCPRGGRASRARGNAREPATNPRALAVAIPLSPRSSGEGLRGGAGNGKSGRKQRQSAGRLQAGQSRAVKREPYFSASVRSWRALLRTACFAEDTGVGGAGHFAGSLGGAPQLSSVLARRYRPRSLWRLACRHRFRTHRRQRTHALLWVWRRKHSSKERSNVGAAR